VSSALRVRIPRALLTLIVLSALLLLWTAGIDVPVLLDVPEFQTGDAQNYLAAAQSFSQDRALIDASGRSLTLFPPGLPLVVGTLLTLGISAEWAVLFINGISVILIVTTVFFLARRILQNEWLALFAAATVGLNASFLRTNQQLWTEPVFAALAMGLFLVLVRAIQERHLSRRALIFAVLLVWASIWLKFLGVTFAFLLAFAVFLLCANFSTRDRWIRTLLALSVGLVGLIPLIVRNLLLGSGAFGDRREAYVSVEGALSNGLQEFGRILVQPETSGLSGVFGVILAVLLVAGFWIAWLRGNRPVQVLGFGVILYWSLLWVSQVRTHVDADIERFVVPMMGPMVVLALYSLVEVWRVSSTTLAQRGYSVLVRGLQVLFAFLFVVLLATNAAKSYLVALEGVPG
jgi:hypothetical protein